MKYLSEENKMNKLLLTIALFTVCNLAQADYNTYQQEQQQAIYQMQFQQQQLINAERQRNQLIQQQMFNEQMNQQESGRQGLNTNIPLMGQPPRLCGPYGCY